MWVFFVNFLGIFCAVFGQQTPVIGLEGTKCYDHFNKPQRCIPEFENAAFNLLMEATNTCGERGEQEYCVQTGITTGHTRKSCAICYPHQHDAIYMTDFINSDNPTWWQSETMFDVYPNRVNLTLNFDKAFDITYVRLIFYSPRPESFSISKKTTKDGQWTPYQYYSATCRDTYGLPDLNYATSGEETKAFCTSEYSDISPLKDGNVAFGTLEGRPSAYKFDSSPELQEWVTATELMITLDRLNTFGDEVFGDEQVLKSYFYAIADVAVGARCKCNGHASECITSTGIDSSRRRVCKCEHNTAGPDCNECLPFYNDAPWARATAQNAHECKQCNCNGYSNRCYFDKTLYEQTGHGGHCLDCTANRDGPNCEKCKENYFMREDGYCIACKCDVTGSRSLQCNAEGRCQCKPGVTGSKCDRCETNHYDYSSNGCKNCGCFVPGSTDNEPNCNPFSGECQCKENVEGKQCSDCKPGYFNLDLENKFGCTPCFCYSHSSECNSAPGFYKYQLHSSFAKSAEKWQAEDEYGRKIQVKYDVLSQSIGIQAVDDEAVYFLAPDRFLGDQRSSYNQLLEFNLRIGDNRPVPSATDIILEGAGATVTNTIFAQDNQVPSIQNQMYKFRLHEHPNYGWQPRLSARSFISILTNLTAIKIKGTYAPQGVGFLDDVKLETAARGVAGQSALWVEQCTCPPGYVGQFCESCAPGFRHSPAHGGPFMPCIPCDCNGHANICDSETGRCICQHNTAGENCELCSRGFYGNALGGTPGDCRPCNCPEGGACIQLEDDLVMCTECPQGYTGHRCDLCSDGYYGDPLGRYGTPSPCQLCECNQNIDPNGIGNCNTTTGECLRCIYNTGGANCEVCLPGFYGNALVLPKGDCKPCECYPLGTIIGEESNALLCDRSTGNCQCKPHVIGRNCNKCEEGYYNLISGEGCHPCNCDPVGSLNQTCDLITGQCYCRSGITGLRCDHCQPRKYGFSSEGCKDCECDNIGSKDLQCDASGQCPCLENVEGRRCDRCKENKYDRHRGCVDCPDCYNLVQNAVHHHNSKLDRLNEILEEIERRPTVITDDQFPSALSQLANDIDQFYDKVKNATGDNSVFQQVKNIKGRSKDINKTLDDIDGNLKKIHDKNQHVLLNLDHIDENIEEVEERLNDIETNLETQGKLALENAWKRAEVAGQQSEKMTKIAQEAREIADNLEKQAENLVMESADAKNKSILAYETAKKANIQQGEMQEELRQLKNDLTSAEGRFNKIFEWGKEVANKSKSAKNDALTLLNEVKNLEIPKIDIKQLKANSDNLREEAFKLGNKTDSLYENSEKLIKLCEEKNENAKKLLDKAYDQQAEIEELLSEIFEYKEIANKSIFGWQKKLNETESIYKDLRDFDKETQKTKQEADRALQTIKEIEEIIMNTIKSTNDAQQSLLEAAESAKSALEKVSETDVLAKNTSKLAENIKEQTELLLKNVTGLIDESDIMQARVEESEERINSLIHFARSNDSLKNEALEKVGKTDQIQKEVSKKIEELLSDVMDIMNELENSPNLDENEIERLEEQIRRTEEQIKSSGLEQTLMELQEKQQTQTEKIEQYKIDIAKLQEDVDNIADIVAALPEGCFKRLELEP